MLNSSIEFKNIIMRCNRVSLRAFLEVDSALEIEFYKNGMEDVWAEIQKNAGEFANESISEVKAYFMDKYGIYQEELGKRCLFLKEKNTNKYIGTCMAWFEYKGEDGVSVLHWLAVDDLYSGRGYARMLITEVMKVFERLGETKKIYLHTQPWSYKAIKLYNDFGFCIAKEDTYGTAVNECEEAMLILKKHMTDKSFEKLERTQVI